MPEPDAHRHNLIHAPTGIGCRGCDLWVPKPPGMPDYSGASMAGWQSTLLPDPEPPGIVTVALGQKPLLEIAGRVAAELTTGLINSGILPEGYKVTYDMTLIEPTPTGLAAMPDPPPHLCSSVDSYPDDAP